MIQETTLLSATNLDVMSAGRLNSIPFAGQLVLEFQAGLNDGTNFFTLTLQEPDGDVPIDAQVVPGVNPALGGVLDERQLLRMVFRARVGGHWVVSLTESGTATCMFRATLTR